MFEALLEALRMSLAMGWEILWRLILDFALLGVVQAVVSYHEMAWLLMLVLLGWQFILAAAALIVEVFFATLGLVPHEHHARG
jgi:hypothetical protein